MADVSLHSAVPPLSIHVESASDTIVDSRTEHSHTNKKYHGHGSQLRNFFTEYSITKENSNIDEYSPNQLPKSQYRTQQDPLESLNDYSMNDYSQHRVRHIPIEIIRTPSNRSYNTNVQSIDNLFSGNSNRRYSNSEQHYDFPADVIQQLRKQQHEGNDSNKDLFKESNEKRNYQQSPTLLPSNVFKRMDQINTVFVKPTKIETSLPKLIFHDEEDSSNEPSTFNETNDEHDDERSESPLFYEKPGLQPLADDDEGDNKTHNNKRRVRFSTAPIRVYPTYSANEYERRADDIDPFAASAEYELEKRIENMDVFDVEIEKVSNGLGISVLGMGIGADSGLEKLGIFVKSLNPNGVIDKDGRIQVGDQIIEVNGQSLVGVTHAFATHVLKTTSGLVKFVIGREKDFKNSEILTLIQHSLKSDEEREKSAQKCEKYHDAYFEKKFDDDQTPEDENKETIPQKFEIEILKQCYESLEKALENTEKEKEHFQELYEELLNEYREMEEKYNQSQLIITELQDQKLQSSQQHTQIYEQQQNKIKELTRRVEELEQALASASRKTEHDSAVERSVDNIFSCSSDNEGDRIHKSAYFHGMLNDRINHERSIMTNTKSANQLNDEFDQNFPINRVHGSNSDPKSFSLKHLSTGSLGDSIVDSEILTVKTSASQIPSIDQSLNQTISSDQYVEIKNWTSDQCIQWLTAQRMTSLIPIFLNRNIDGEKLLLLDGAKMKAMGIKSSKERDQLKTQIKELKHVELSHLREQNLHQMTSIQQRSSNGRRLRSSSLTKLRERRFFRTNAPKQEDK